MSENFDRGLYKAIELLDDLEPWPMAFAELLIGLVVVIGTMGVMIGSVALAVSIFSPLM